MGPVNGTATQRKAVTPEERCAMTRYARTYAAIYAAEYAAIKSVDPTAQVLIGETSPRVEATVFISELMRGTGLLADGYAHHTYQESDPNYPDPNRLGIGRLDVLRQMLDDGANRAPFALPRATRCRSTSPRWPTARATARSRARTGCARPTRRRARSAPSSSCGTASAAPRAGTACCSAPATRTPTFETFRSLRC